MANAYKTVTSQEELMKLSVGDRVRFVGGPFPSTGNTYEVEGVVEKKSQSLKHPLDYISFRRAEDKGEVPRGVPKGWQVNQRDFSDPNFYTPDGKLKYDTLFEEGVMQNPIMKKR